MKTFATFLFLLAVGALVFFTWGWLSAPGAADNYFNRTWRPRLDHSVTLRNIFGLHDDGDARYDYLGSRYKNIVLEVDSMEQLLPDKEVLQELAAKIQKVTGKPTEYKLSDIDLPQEFSNGDQTLVRSAASYQNYRSGGDTAYVYLLVLSQEPGSQLLIGKTLNEDGIILYESALKEFTANHPNTQPNYELSTALHEFGHQLGLAHNDKPGCLMSSHAESGDQAKSDPYLVLTDFCEFEVGQIKSMVIQ